MPLAVVSRGAFGAASCSSTGPSLPASGPGAARVSRASRPERSVSAYVSWACGPRLGVLAGLRPVDAVAGRDAAVDHGHRPERSLGVVERMLEPVRPGVVGAEWRQAKGVLGVGEYPIERRRS